jgi:hypothetical protein
MELHLNRYEDCLTIEQVGKETVVPFIKRFLAEGAFVITDKGNLSEMLQRECGDAVANSHDGRVWGIEWKIEQENKYGNFFLETWSNRSRFKTGWMFNLNTDILLYFFIREQVLYSISFRKLRKWAFHDGRIYSFEEKMQKKTCQLNDTWGRCVPITVVEKEVGLTKYDI